MSSNLIVNKDMNQTRTLVTLKDGITCGGRELTVIAGPCAVESREQMQAVVASLREKGISGFRGCIFKPRTSPYSFQGLGASGVEILKEMKELYSLPVVTEVMSAEQIDAVYDYVDVFQSGSRNMQNFELLKVAGALRKPVLLKRGLSATIEEFLMAAEYVLAGGNDQVILCERGIRSFDSSTRNVLDLGAVCVLKKETHLPVMVDPSHAAGKRELVADLALASVACGADGLLIECHPTPELSVSDARQALSLDEMTELLKALDPVAKAVGRTLRV